MTQIGLFGTNMSLQVAATKPRPYVQTAENAKKAIRPKRDRDRFQVQTEIYFEGLKPVGKPETKSLHDRMSEALVRLINDHWTHREVLDRLIDDTEIIPAAEFNALMTEYGHLREFYPIYDTKRGVPCALNYNRTMDFLATFAPPPVDLPPKPEGDDPEALARYEDTVDALMAEQKRRIEPWDNATEAIYKRAFHTGNWPFDRVVSTGRV